MSSSPATLVSISQAADPAKAIRDGIGDLSKVDVMFGRLLLGIYIGPEKTKGGIIRPQGNIQEDIWQASIGLVLKVGPLAFKDDEHNQFGGQAAKVGDWVMFRPGDTLRTQINGVNCRILQDTLVQMVVKDPEIVTHRKE